MVGAHQTKIKRSLIQGTWNHFVNLDHTKDSQIHQKKYFVYIRYASFEKKQTKTKSFRSIIWYIQKGAKPHSWSQSVEYDLSTEFPASTGPYFKLFIIALKNIQVGVAAQILIRLVWYNHFLRWRILVFRCQTFLLSLKSICIQCY